MDDSKVMKPYPPLWARKLIVLGVMALAFLLMVLSLPFEDRGKFFWMLTNLGIPLLVFLLVMGVFIVLMKWASE